MQSTPSANHANGISVRTILSLFKLRIGVVIMFTALAGLAVTPGAGLSWWQTIVLALSVLVSSASAGAFNQYYERDLDPLMARTSKRPFATGELRHGPLWLLIIGALSLLSVGAAWIALNAWSALYVFLGAFFYAIVYTVWLKRHTWLNIVFGGLAGSWAVLAGAAAADPHIGAVPLALAFILFLWTPPHFWSLAIAFQADYAAIGVPMLPVVVGDKRAARVIFVSTLALVAASFLPLAFGLGVLYFAGAAAGGLLFVQKAWLLARDTNRKTAMTCFHASLIQLTLVLLGAIFDAQF
ncbi:heme o synthase [Propionivibrio sp.]|uniref:heme o synthase n=3 Tax=Propionivibrio sp. TaxID=2212460 RepID=UPI002622A891|nr:heme o synthase [Propionivibrio sp.]MBK7357319.1 protoheme IX farnesyltransferase [Propionivibrio sp.]MBK8401277.1 protoheme IX farnesyltransferase [Propionivibrio sp.]MBK8743167.1 protoheme IX farnesyltransferase [Propionivibrio sp.]MBK8894828.1 protoheme IX farnesyltransferase [Propionivibrio sp.]